MNGNIERKCNHPSEACSDPDINHAGLSQDHMGEVAVIL